MKTVVALAVAAAAALTFSSCTCPACGGSGLQVQQAGGLVPYSPLMGGGSAAWKVKHTTKCVACKGTGTQGVALVKEGVSIAGDIVNMTR